MKDFNCSISFSKNNKKVWILRCDEKTLNEIESLINFYLVKSTLKDDFKK